MGGACIKSDEQTGNITSLLQQQQHTSRKKNNIITLSKMLASVDPDTVPSFTFNGVVTHVRVCKVHDGDTCTVLFYPGKDIYESMVKYRVRLAKIDAPELSTTEGKISRDALKTLILGRILTGRFGNFDKWGRPLIYLYDLDDRNSGDDSKSINMRLVREGYATLYSA